MPVYSKPTTRKPNQRERVRRRLEAGWTCGTWFITQERILRYTARIYELREEGAIVQRRSCEDPYHHHSESHMFEWRIPPEADPSSLFGGWD